MYNEFKRRVIVFQGPASNLSMPVYDKEFIRLNFVPKEQLSKARKLILCGSFVTQMAPLGRIYKYHITRDTLIQGLYGSRNMERKDINYVFEETPKVPKLEQQPYVNPEIMKVIFYSFQSTKNHSRKICLQNIFLKNNQA